MGKGGGIRVPLVPPVTFRLQRACLPTVSRTVPTGPQWAMRSSTTVSASCATAMASVCAATHTAVARPVARRCRGHARSPRPVTLDREVVICGADGVSQFDRMRAVFGRRGSREAFLYAFDILELETDFANDMSDNTTPPRAGIDAA